MMPESPLLQKTSWDLFFKIHVKCWHLLMLWKKLLKCAPLFLPELSCSMSLAGSTPQHRILTWLCKLGSWGLLGLTLADLRLCWAKGISSSPGTRIHSQDQQTYKSAWKDPWRALSAFRSLLHHFWGPQCHSVGSGNVCYWELFGGGTVRGMIAPFRQHPCFTWHHEQDFLTHEVPENLCLFKGEKCL